MNNGAVYFSDVTGGGSSGTFSNVGLYFNGSLSAPAIIGTDIFGGPGTSNSLANGNHGVVLTSSAIMGGVGTQFISLNAGSLGMGIGECGMALQGQMIVAGGGQISLTGVGGGFYSDASGTSNHGLWLDGLTTTNQVTFTGIGGTGGAGSNDGVFVQAALTLNETGGSNVVTFLNCVGGSGGTTDIGINVSANILMVNGLLQFRDVTGGSGSSANYGLYINSGATVMAPTILGGELLGGPGSGTDYGLYVTGTLGGVLTNQLQINGGSLGVGSNEYGIAITSGGTVQLGAAGTLLLTGTGGGFYSGAGTMNYGIYLSGATLTAEAITVTGVGGTGLGTTMGSTSLARHWTWWAAHCSSPILRAAAAPETTMVSTSLLRAALSRLRLSAATSMAVLGREVTMASISAGTACWADRSSAAWF